MNGRTLHVVRRHCGNELIDVVAHQVELMLSIHFGRMKCDFRRWQRKDQPTFANIDIVELENVFEERAVGIGVD